MALRLKRTRRNDRETRYDDDQDDEKEKKKRETIKELEHRFGQSSRVSLFVESYPPKTSSANGVKLSNALRER